MHCQCMHVCVPALLELQPHNLPVAAGSVPADHAGGADRKVAQCLRSQDALHANSRQAADMQAEDGSEQ